MEPVAAVALFCNVLDLSDRAIRTYKTFREIYKDANGHREKDAKLQASLIDMQWVWDELQLSNARFIDGVANKQFQDLSERIQSLSEALKDILDQCQADRPRHFLSATKATFRSLTRKGDIDQRLNELDRCHHDLTRLICVHTYREVIRISTLSEKLLGGHREIQSTLQDLISQLKDPESAKDIPDVLRVAKESTAKVWMKAYSDLILKSIEYPNIRCDNIRNAASHTFEWVLDGNDIRNELKESESFASERLRETKRLFASWLKSGCGIFHIAGKPGSGKSTLMKFIIEHQSTQDLLQQWAGHKKLVLASFFLWKPGDRMQNSLRGLIHGVLHSVIRYVPDLACVLFPHYKNLTLEELLKRWNVDIRGAMMTEAFERLIAEREFLDVHRVCFFIDGLDEFVEGHELVLHGELVRTLKSWVSSSGGDIKLCVSSRESPAFEEITLDQKIHLHHLTHRDIDRYVQTTLRRNERFAVLMSTDCDWCYQIVNEIVHSAQGVFLWVAMVVKSVENGLTNRDSNKTLLARVKSMPENLEEMFARILGSIEHCYQKEVYLLLSIALKTHAVSNLEVERNMGNVYSHNLPKDFISLIGFTVLSLSVDNADNTQAALTDSNLVDRDLITEEHLLTTTSRLAGRLNGLMEVVDFQTEDGPDNGSGDGSTDGSSMKRVVKFIHRSIFDYLEFHVPPVASYLGITDDLVARTMCSMLIGETRLFNLVTSGNALESREKLTLPCAYPGFICERVPFLILVLRCSRLEELNSMFYYLDCLEDSLARMCRPGLDPLTDQAWAASDSMRDMHYRSHSRACLHNLSVITSVCSLGFHEYISWKLQQGWRVRPDGALAQHLLCLAHSSWASNLGSSYGPTLDLLFSGGISPACLVPSFYLHQEDIYNQAFDDLWTGFVVTLWLGAQSIKFWTGVEIFLRRGALPLCHMEITKIGGEPGKGDTTYVTMRGPGQYKDSSCYLDYADRLSPRLNGIYDRDLSFKDVVNHMQPANWDLLLALLERNLERNLEQMSHTKSRPFGADAQDQPTPKARLILPIKPATMHLASPLLSFTSTDVVDNHDKTAVVDRPEDKQQHKPLLHLEEESRPRTRTTLFAEFKGAVLDLRTLRWLVVVGLGVYCAWLLCLRSKDP
ncbi:hypothetical protein BJ170DRAFT_721005 [Xylariales sp. AK1849]|nr:hypothetical protein BJ170DRAFT_721005 [Xylariales sp. AK1849]